MTGKGRRSSQIAVVVFAALYILLAVTTQNGRATHVPGTTIWLSPLAMMFIGIVLTLAMVGVIRDWRKHEHHIEDRDEKIAAPQSETDGLRASDQDPIAPKRRV